MIKIDANKSLQTKIYEQTVFLQKMAIFNSDFNDTLNLIVEMNEELQNSSSDLNRMNDIARNLERTNEILRKQLKEKKNWLIQFSLDEKGEMYYKQRKHQCSKKKNSDERIC